MLMVVFGAGASYDSSPDYKIPRGTIQLPSVVVGMRPPLANQLFELRDIFTEAAQGIPKCQAIIPELRYLPKDTSVEQVLEEKRRASIEYPEGRRQLVAIRFYLQWIIRKSQFLWNKTIRGQTTYRSLIAQIDRQVTRREPVCFVTFNYDTLLEDAFTSFDVKFETLDDYVSRQDYKIIKLHGSSNWAREISSPYTVTIFDVVQLANELLSHADGLELTDTYRLLTPELLNSSITPYMRIPNKAGQQAVFPAISIPVEKKQSYECPEEHLKVLKECIPKVDKLLIVGWKAAEENFVDLLASMLPKGIHKAVVSRDVDSARNTSAKLQAAGLEQVNWFLGEDGFTNLVQSGWIENFVRGLGQPY